MTQAGADARNELVAFVRECCPELQKHPLLVEAGDPVEVIRRAVERADADLAVIGTRGHTGLKRMLLGSVADEALRTLECDILAIGSTADILQAARRDRADDGRYSCSRRAGGTSVLEPGGTGFLALVHAFR